MEVTAKRQFGDILDTYEIIKLISFIYRGHKKYTNLQEAFTQLL